MENPDDLAVADARRAGHLEGIDPLIGIEQPELVADDRLVVDDERRATDHVVDEVEGTAPVGVERISVIRRILDDRGGRRRRGGGRRGRGTGFPEPGGVQMEVEARKKLRRRRRRRDDRLLGRGPGRARQQQARRDHGGTGRQPRGRRPFGLRDLFGL